MSYYDLATLKVPYPTWEEMQEKLGWDFVLDAEYGMPNHELCKEIYEHLGDPVVVDAAARKIFNRGGKQALNANWQTLKKYTEIKNNPKSQELLDKIIKQFF